MIQYLLIGAAAKGRGVTLIGRYVKAPHDAQVVEECIGAEYGTVGEGIVVQLD